MGSAGSGFTDEQRDHIWDNQDEYLGRIIEITAEGLGANSNLRFPRFERFRDEDGQADTFERVAELLGDV